MHMLSVTVLFLALLSHSFVPVEGSRSPTVKSGPLELERRILRFVSPVKTQQRKQIASRPPPFPPATAGIVLLYSVIASELTWRVANGVGLTTAHVLMATTCVIALLHGVSVIPVRPWVFFYEMPKPRTYMMSAFAHKDASHLISNMYSLSSYGVPVSQRIGNRRLAYLYMIGTWVSKLIGHRIFEPLFMKYRESTTLFLRDLFTVLLKPFGLKATLLGRSLLRWRRPTASLGASGAISGLQAYCRLSSPRNTTSGVLFTRIAWLDVLLLTGIEGLKGLLGRTAIGHASHLGGTCVGVFAFYCEKIFKFAVEDIPKLKKNHIPKEKKAGMKRHDTITTSKRKNWTWGSIAFRCRRLGVRTIKWIIALSSRGPLSTMLLLWELFYS